MAKTDRKKHASRKERIQRQSATYFEDQKAVFGGLVGHALRVSNGIGVQRTIPPRGHASELFLRTCITARTILHTCTPLPATHGVQYLDHASIASLCRDLIDNIAVLRYIGDDQITEEEWICRKHIIDVHDCVNRTAFLELIGRPPERPEILEGLQQRLKADKFFKQIDPKRQKRLLAGDDMFIDGRQVALSVFGWGPNQTKGVYKYLSHQTHTQSMAFHRTGINQTYEPDSAYAKGVAGWALEWAGRALGFAILHMVTLFPYLEAHFDRDTFTALKEQYTAPTTNSDDPSE